MKKRDIGEPTIIVHTLPGTPEQIAENRERFRSVCETAMSEVVGQPVSLKIDWGDSRRNQIKT